MPNADPAPARSVLVRVAPEILERMKTGDIEPVVILGVQEQEDGTYDMTLKIPDVEAENRQLRDALHTICGLTHQDIDEEPFWRLVSRIHDVARRAVDPSAKEIL